MPLPRYKGKVYGRAGPSLSKKVKTLSKKVHRLERTDELKQITLGISATGITTTPTTTHLTAVATGNDHNNRDGNELSLKYLQFDAILTANGSGSLADQLMRVVIFQDKQQEEAVTPTVADVFGTASPSIYEVQNFVDRKRWRILYDRVLTCGVSGSGGAGTSNDYPSRRSVRIRCKVPKTSVGYSGTASSDILKNGIYMMRWSQEATQGPTLGGQFRVGFKG